MREVLKTVCASVSGLSVLCVLGIVSSTLNVEARPTTSQQQKVDKVNTVPQDFETKIIAATPEDRARAQRIIEMYKMIESKPTIENWKQYVAPGYIQHNAFVPNGPEPIAMLFSASVDQYPVQIDVHKVIVVGEWAMAHVNFRRVDTAEEDDLGKAAVDIYLFRPDGKIAEHWDVIQSVPTYSANSNGMFLQHYRGDM
ncbi:MAG: nuclear transport factor 2 family protein [Myxococcota bacterium]